MVVFSFLDWFWLVAFIVLMVGSGVRFYRLGKRSESDFFLAGRGLPWWLPRLLGLRDAHRDRHPDVGFGGGLQVRPFRALVYLLRGVVRDKRLRLHEDLPQVARLHPGRMAVA